VVQQRGIQLARPGDGAVPQLFQDLPRVAEARRVGRTHRGALRVTPVQLRLHEGTDLDPVDDNRADLAGQVQAHHVDTTHHDTDEVRAAQPQAGHVDATQAGAGEVDPVEGRSR
jgi:hypothetical protein